ncbi:MAG: CDP-2,3-bis-(O-geranylgeranyl)-sn-glycerol synthase [Candidatus Thermoplasmatota archaeon]|nr:CDP-2,3-bis-(O-geranylgeranyl)-sn-glycerol synthase [Candidatus Thermoplasmatota archaeon]
MVYDILLESFWIIIPAYVANASAVLVGGGKPIDFGKKFKNGKRILGDGKTWKGLFIGTFIGMTAGFGLSVVARYAQVYNLGIHLPDFTGFPMMIPIIFSICFGALMGDTVESFFKRRRNIPRGSDWIPFDQLDFILGVLISVGLMSFLLQSLYLLPYNWFLKEFSVYHILTLLIATPFIHLLTNFGHKKILNQKTEKQTI